MTMEKEDTFDVLKSSADDIKVSPPETPTLKRKRRRKLKKKKNQLKDLPDAEKWLAPKAIPKGKNGRALKNIDYIDYMPKSPKITTQDLMNNKQFRSSGMRGIDQLDTFGSFFESTEKQNDDIDSYVQSLTDRIELLERREKEREIERNQERENDRKRKREMVKEIEFYKEKVSRLEDQNK